MKETIDTLSGMSMHEIGAHRSSQLRKWVMKIREVQKHQEEIRGNMTRCLEVLERARIILQTKTSHLKRLRLGCSDVSKVVKSMMSVGYGLSSLLSRIWGAKGFSTEALTSLITHWG